MTIEQRLERDLPDILGNLAVGPYPDYIDDVLSTTARRGQRPSWTFPERWLPLELVSQRATFARMPWRQLGVLALIAVLLAAALAVYIGSQQRRLPPPFGEAANGQVVFAQNGDVYWADPGTGTTEPIVTGPSFELGPVVSPDGTHVLFARGGTLFVVRDDGSDLVQLNREPLALLTDWGFSPDGTSVVAFANGGHGLDIIVARSDGRGEPQRFETFATSDDGPPVYRADGSEILFVGKEPGRAHRGVYALAPATKQVRTLVAPPAALDIFGADWSPDGTRIAYGVFDPTKDAPAPRTHVVNSDGTGDVQIDIDPRSLADGLVMRAPWSNDGTRLIVERFYSFDESIPARNVIVPVDRSNGGVEMACPADDCLADWSWSPDDSMLLGSFERNDGTTVQLLGDPKTGQIRSAPWTATGHPDWQRLAP